VRLFYGLAWPLLVASSLGYLAGLANSYLFKSRWTFGDRIGGRAPMRPLLYVGLNGVGLLLGNLTVATLALVLPAWLAKPGAGGISFAWNYWSSDRRCSCVAREHVPRRTRDATRKQVAARAALL
jgi:putative flippase GtrA